MRGLLCVLVAALLTLGALAQTYETRANVGTTVDNVFLLLTTKSVLTAEQVLAIESSSGALLTYSSDIDTPRFQMSLAEFTVTDEFLFLSAVNAVFPDWNGIPHESLADMPPLTQEWLLDPLACAAPADLPSVIVTPNFVVDRLSGGGGGGDSSLSANFDSGLSTWDCLSWTMDRIDQELGTNRKILAQLSGVGVSIYIVDSGIKSDHVEFSNPNTDGNRLSRVVDDFAFPFSTEPVDGDCNGHGTSVAAIAGGARVGLAFESTMRDVKVLDCDGSGSALSLSAGLLHILATHASSSVVNLALSSGDAEPMTAWLLLKLLHCDRVLVVAAAGNDDADACSAFPAMVPSVLAVAATDKDDQRATFSNFGKCISLLAPGVDAETALATGANDYGKLTGTSAAAPLVAAAAALFLQLEPMATPQAITFGLLNSSTTDVIENESGSPNRLLMVLPWAAPEPDFGPVREYSQHACTQSRTTSRAVIVITAVVFSVLASALLLLLVAVMTWHYVDHIKNDKLYEPPKVVPKMQRQLTRMKTATSLAPAEPRVEDDEASESSSPAFRPSSSMDRPMSQRPQSNKDKSPAVISDDGATSPKKEKKKRSHEHD